MITKDIDTGLSTLSRYWTRDDANVLQLAYELQDAECGVLRENKIGQIVFESRAHRPAHTAAYTFGTGGLYMWNLRQEDPLRGIYNQVDIERRTFNVSDDTLLAVVSDISNDQGGTPPTIANGSTTISIRFPGPGSPSNYIAVASWGTVDVEVNTAIDGTGTDITNSNITLSRTEYADRIDITFVSTYGSNAYAVLLRAHGTAVVEGDPVPVSASDATSISNYRKRIYPNASHWLTDADEAQDYCDHVLALYKDPHARVTFEVKANYSAAHLAAVAAIDVSDKIHIHATVATYGLGIDGDFFVEYIRHRVDSGRVHVVEYQCRAAATHSWPASGASYTSKIIPDGVPDDLYVNSIDPEMHILFGCRCWKYNQNITGARFRAKFYSAQLGKGETADLRTLAEGGSMIHDPDNGMYVVDTPFLANQYGAQYEFDSPTEGYWYFAFQLTSKAGDSVWSDGNKRPRYVEDFAVTNAAGASTGPPDDWYVEVMPDPTGRHAVIVKASRPKTNGQKIWAWVAQIKDITTGVFSAIGSNGPTVSNVYYGDINDSAHGDISHTASNNNTRFTRGANPHGGLCGYHVLIGDIAHVGDLILFDPRGGLWEEKECSWGTVDTIQGLKAGYDVYTADYFDVAGRFHNTVLTDLRLLIVKPPWSWNSDGYFGDEANHGLYERWYWDNGEHGDTTTEIFISDPIDVPSSVPLANIAARVWFDNGYSRWDGGIITGSMANDSGNPSGASGLQILTTADDPAIPIDSVAFQWNRETANYKGISVIAAWVSAALPAEGPYYDERAGNPATIVETGTCTVTAGNKSITCSRAASAAVIGKIFLIYTNDASPDSDLDGNVVVSEKAGEIVLSSPFMKSGSFDYAVVDCWWPNEGSSNVAYYQWAIQQVTYDVEKTVWRTPPVAWPSGAYYVTLANRNSYGLGTELVAGGVGTPDPPHEYVSQGCVALSVAAGAVATNTDIGRIFKIDSDSNYTLSNPTGTHYCGMTVLWMCSGAGVPTLGSKFRLMDGELIDKSYSRDLLAGIYNAVDDQWDTFFKKGTPVASASLSPSGSTSSTESASISSSASAS